MEFLTTKGIAAEIENIIRLANEFIYIITPYEQIDDSFLRRLRVAQNKNVTINFVMGKRNNSEIETGKLNSLTKVSFSKLGNLHAKCYMNENTAIITSMNLYDYSIKNNFEMGIKIKKTDNEKIFREILDESKIIIDNSKKIDFDNEKKSITVLEDAINFDDCAESSYCICCDKLIESISTISLCSECSKSWRKWIDEKLKKDFCLNCGKKYSNTLQHKPLTESVTIDVDGKERECRNGVLEGFKNAVRQLDSVIDLNNELCDENNNLVMENMKLKEQLNKRNSPKRDT